MRKVLTKEITNNLKSIAEGVVKKYGPNALGKGQPRKMSWEMLYILKIIYEAGYKEAKKG